ncbi:hypothetical protein [Jutongia sp.]
MSHSANYFLGIVSGILVSLLMVYVIRYLTKKFCASKNPAAPANGASYDERQVLARGSAYQKAFFVLLVYLMIASGLDECFKTPVLMSMGGLWIGICISLLVFAGICIFKDAYLSLQENLLSVNVLGIIGGGVNVWIGLIRVIGKHPFLVNGRVSYQYINVFVGILCLLLLLMVDMKHLYDKQMEGSVS